MPLTNKEIEKILRSIWNGDISVFNLPENIFEFTYSELIKMVDNGFGGGVGDFTKGSIRAGKALSYQNNIYTFSGAKTFNEVKDLSMFIFNEDGAKRPFKEFREHGQRIDNTYNVDWLRTEQDTAFGMSQSADKWIGIEEDQELFPLLQYQTAADERVRDDHAQWDNIIRPVNDSFWDTNMPINGWNCRCTVVRLSEGSETNIKGIKLNDDKLFGVNPGKVDYIFDPKTHPYYKVENKFKPMLKDNFGFKIPDK